MRICRALLHRRLQHNEVFNAAVASDSIIITRDRGFADERNWPADFSAGVIFINLPDNSSASAINGKITNLLTKRLPVSLLGAVTYVEQHRALSRLVRRRP